MEAAAKTVELLTQRTLPDTPYYLSNSPHWRYRPRPDDHKRPEEWHSTRLQYSTLLAEADRGLLLTRPDYDMREEPPKPVSRDIASLSKTGGEKKKLSLTDYKNKKTANPSTSPPEPSISRIRDSHRPVAYPSSSPAASGPRPPLDPRSYPNSNTRRPPDPHPTDARKQRPDDARPRLKEYVADMSLPLKPPVKHASLPRPPSPPSSKKRVADHYDDSRPQKRTRPENPRQADREDLAPRKDPPSQTSCRREPLLNGKSSLKGATVSARNPSPAPRPRGEAVNGSRHNVDAKSAPARQESPNKPVVPPLLSPLHLNFDGESPSKNDRRRANNSPPRMKKSDYPLEQKKRRPPRPIPPLLSPTLPPVIEEALQRRKQGSADSDDRPRESTNEGPAKSKKALSNDDTGDDLVKKPTRRFMVHLKIPKRLRKSVQRIMAMPTSRDRDTSRYDYDRLSDDERQHARKRPPTAAEIGSVAMKKSRSSDIPNHSSRERRPTTPPRKSNNATAMSRANLSSSTAHTPGESMRRTPSLGGPTTTTTTTTDKRPNGVPTTGKLDDQGLREKESHMRKVGTQLKHSADNAFKGRRSPAVVKDGGGGGGSSSSSRPRASSNEQQHQSSVKLGFMLGIESILCFMQGFQAQSTLRVMYGKKPDATGWQSLFPLCDYILCELQRVDSRRNRPPYVLLLLLQVFAADEVIRCHLVAQDYAPAPGPGPAATMEVVKYERLRGRALVQIRDALAAIENPRLRPDATPWSTLDEITETTLRIMRRWCSEEDVGWSPELSPRDYGR